MIHFCARCSGQVLGFLGMLVLFWVGTRQPLPLFVPNTQFLFALAPVPAAFDWTSQALGRRESSNLLRVASGCLLGFALTDLLIVIVTQRWLYAVGGGIAVGVIIAGVLLTLRLSGAWRRVMEEHFPGFELGPG